MSSEKKQQNHHDEQVNDGGDRKSLLGDFLKKAVTTGMEAVFLTEEMVKSTLQEASLSKEGTPLLQQLGSLRKEVFQLVTQELKNQLQKVDVTKELSRVLEFYDLEVSAKIKFVPKSKDAVGSEKKSI